MDDLKYVRKRIRSRKRYPYEEEHSPFLFRMLYRMMILTMCLGILALGFLINQKTGWVELPANIKNFNFAQIQEWIPFEGWFSLKSEPVSSYPAYTLLKDDMYANGSNTAYNMVDGVVLHVQQKENGKGSITIKQDNGVVVTYSALTSISVKQDERILKGSTIGTFESSVTIQCVKNDAKIDLQTAQQPA